MKLHKNVSHHVIDSELIPLVVVIGSLSLMFPFKLQMFCVIMFGVNLLSF